MLNVSNKAAQVLREALQESGVRPETGLRLALSGTNWILQLDTPDEEDRVIRFDGSVVLIIGPVIDWVVQDGLIDIVSDDLGFDLVLRRGNGPGMYATFSAS